MQWKNYAPARSAIEADGEPVGRRGTLWVRLPTLLFAGCFPQFSETIPPFRH